MNNFQWNFNQNAVIFIEENAFQNVVSKMWSAFSGLKVTVALVMPQRQQALTLMTKFLRCHTASWGIWEIKCFQWLLPCSSILLMKQKFDGLIYGDGATTWLTMLWVQPHHLICPICVLNCNLGLVISHCACADFNSLWPSDAIWRQRSGSTLAQVMAWCLTAPSHYLNQCWLIIRKVEWHSSKGKFTRDNSAINHWNYLENQVPRISFKFPRG